MILILKHNTIKITVGNTLLIYYCLCKDPTLMLKNASGIFIGTSVLNHGHILVRDNGLIIPQPVNLQES